MTGVISLQWNTSIVCPIPKKSTSGHIDAFHLIVLTKMFWHLFEKCLLMACENSYSMHLVRKFSPIQAVYRRGFSTQSHVLYSHEISLCHDLHQVFIDFKAAYDTVPVTVVTCISPKRMHKYQTLPDGRVRLVLSTDSPTY